MGTIRKAVAADLEAVGNLLRQVLAVHNAGRPDLFRSTGKKYSDERILEIFSNPETPVFVYDEGGRALGYVFCELITSTADNLQPVTTLYIDDLCVDEAARGKHIGTSLYEYAKEFGRKAGCHNLTLHGWECNPGARSFYESLGLRPQYTSREQSL